MPKNPTEDRTTREAGYLCTRRSTLEMETLLTDFFEREWSGMDEEMRQEFMKIAKSEDADLERYIFKNQKPPVRLSRDLIEKLRRHSLK